MRTKGEYDTLSVGCYSVEVSGKDGKIHLLTTEGIERLWRCRVGHAGVESSLVVGLGQPRPGISE